MDRLWTRVDAFLPHDVRTGAREQVRATRLLVVFTFGIALAAAAFSLVALELGEPIAAVVLLGSTGFFASALVTLRVFGSRTLAAHQTVFGVVLLETSLATFLGGMEQSGFVWVVTVPVLATLLIGKRAALLWTVVVMASFASVAGLELASVDLGRALEAPHSVIGWAATGSGLAFFLLLLATMFEAAKDRMNTELVGARRQAEDERDRAEQARAQARLVLDVVDQGLVMVCRDGTVVEHSAAAEAWLGEHDPGAPIWAWLSGIDGDAASWVELGFTSLAEDLLPEEMILDQLPRTMKSDERLWQLRFDPIRRDDSPWTHMLVVIRDVTEAMRASDAERARHDALQVFTHLRTDRDGFHLFFAEGTRLVDEVLAASDPGGDFRRIHTLKGNSGIFGLEALVRTCHAIEDRLAGGAECSNEDRMALKHAWDELRGCAEPLGCTDERSNRVEIPLEQIESLLRAIDRGTSHAQLFDAVHAWKLEPVGKCLGRLAEHARALARRRGRADIAIAIDDGGLLLEPGCWDAFWSAAVHLVRNAVDHGIESAEERIAVDKPEHGTLQLVARKHGSLASIEMRDDGRGIDWARVAVKAATLGLPCGTEGELNEALFAEGLSTSSTVDETSGRGVGMASLRDACHRLGGTIEIESAPGRGTTFRFVLPLGRDDAHAHAA